MSHGWKDVSGLLGDRAAEAGRLRLNIGVAFPHEKGDGFNVILQALPLHGQGKLVLQAYDPEAQAAPEGVEKSTG